MAQWTTEQKSAITADGGTLLVSAAAGSGKTSVLSARVIRALTDPEHPIDADRMLIVTFTKAAAAEMKQRIANRLGDLLAQNPGDRRLQRQKLLLDHAHISTVHSFCSDLLHEHFHELGISPTFRIASADEMLLLSGQVADELCEAAYGRIRSGAPGLAELADLFSDDRDDRRFGEVIRRLYDYVRSHPFPEHWLRRQAAQYRDAEMVSGTEWAAVLFDYARGAAEYGVILLEGAMAEAAQDPQFDAYRAVLMEEMIALVRIHEAAEAHDWDALVYAVQRRTSPRLPTLRKVDESRKARIKALRDGVKKQVEKLTQLFDQSSGDAAQEIAAQAPVIDALAELVLEYGQRLDAAKRAKNLLDFSDLEHGALRLLIARNADGGFRRTDLAIALSAQFDEIMVDEYQDTNGAQEYIFKAISRDESNLFLVGDVKQSIYQFRQASPELFIRRRQAYPLYDPANPQFPATILLGKNFRSRSGVTGACNFLFRQLMSPAVGDIRYDDSEALIPQAVYPDSPTPDAALVLLEPAGDDTEPEAEWIAARIQALMNSGGTVTQNGVRRPAQYRDFCILLRSAASRADDYLRVLQQHGIPCWGAVQSGFFQSREIAAMLALLRVIDNPVQDVPLLAVLCGPVYGFGPDELARIRQATPDAPLYSALRAAAESDAHAAEFLRDLDRWRRRAAAGSVRTLVERIWDEKQIGAVYAAMKDGALRLANLRLLMEYAVTYEQAGYRGLSGFIRYIDRLQAQRADLTPASILSESANVVRIMTIHHAKGLEFPFVFVADCARPFNQQSLTGDLLLHPKLGAALRRRDGAVRYHTVPYDAVRCALNRDEMSEQMRVLYVALTRAREKLYLLCTVPHPETRLAHWAAVLHGDAPIAPFAVRSAQCFADWILAALLRHPDMGALRAMADADCTVIPDDHAWALEHIAARRMESEPPAPEPEALPDPAMLAALRARFAFAYDRPALSRIPVKSAISALAERAQAQTFATARRPAFLTDGGLTPAERGTALHTYLQFADYEAAARDPAAELRRLTDAGYLTTAQSDAVEPARIAALFAHPLGQRILHAPTVHREVRFLLEYPAAQWDPAAGGGDEAVVLQGVADCVLEYDDGLVLIDFKTDRASADVLRQRYAQQLALYARALAGCFGKPVREQVLYATYLGDVVPL